MRSFIVEYHLRSRETVLERVYSDLPILDIMDQINKKILHNKIIQIEELFKDTRYIGIRTDSIDYFSINGGNE